MQNVYKLPNAPKSMGGLQWQALAVGLVLLFLSNVAATQYMAYQFGYQLALGRSLIDLAGHSIYAPFMWIVWAVRYNQMQHPAVQHALWATLTIAAGGSVGSVIAAGGVMFYRTRKLQKGNEHLHGSARWAERADIIAAGLLPHEGKPSEGVYVGGWVDPKTQRLHYLRHNGPEHIIGFAPTRSGKGVGLVIPTLLSWPASAVVYDIKGENYALSAGWRMSCAGNRVLKFSPVEVGTGVGFNPLAEIRVGTPRDVSDAQNIAFMLTHPKGDADDEDHWVESATSLLTGVILYTCYAALREGRIASLPEVAQVLTKPGQAFSETLNEMLLTEQDPEKAFGWLSPTGKPTSIHPVVAEKAQEMLDKEDKELSGILSSAKVKLQLYSDPIVSSNINRSDFTVDELVNGEKPATLYYVVPPSDKDRLKPLTRLMFALIVNRLTEHMEFKDGRSVQTHQHRLLMLLDEFPTLGRMDTIVNGMGYTAGYGIKFYLIVQDKVQLNAVYGENELVFSGTHLRIAYAPNNPETAEMLSGMTGTMTIVKQSFSYSGNRLSPILNQVTTNVDEIERPLLTPDECGRLPGAKKDASGNIVEAGDMLIFATGFPAIYGKQILYFKDKVFMERAKMPAPHIAGAHYKAVRPGAPAPRPAAPAPSPEEAAQIAAYPAAGPDVAAAEGEVDAGAGVGMSDAEIAAALSAAEAGTPHEHQEATIDYEALLGMGQPVQILDEAAAPEAAADPTDEWDFTNSAPAQLDEVTPPTRPAPPYVRKHVAEAEEIALAMNPDLEPVDPAPVKPPRKARAS